MGESLPWNVFCCCFFFISTHSSDFMHVIVDYLFWGMYVLRNVPCSIFIILQVYSEACFPTSTFNVLHEEMKLKL